MFRKHYQAGAVLHAEVYPGIRQLCAMLRERGIGMAVATNKPQRFAEALVQHFGLSDYLSPVCGADEAGRLKKADLIYETKEKNFIYYSLNTSVFEEIMLWVSQFTGGSAEKEGQTHEESEET